MALKDYHSRGTFAPATITALLRSRAQSQTNDLAYAFLADGESVRDRMTYADLDQQAQTIAGLLRRHRVGDQPVLLLYPPGLEYVAAFFGCMYAGAIAVPAYPPHRNRSLDRLRSIVNDSGARAVLCTVSVRESIERSFAEAPDLQRLDWLATDEPGALDVNPFCDESVTPDRLAFLQYTSGSTSEPKGVMLSHGNLCHNAQLITKGFKLGYDSTAVFWLPLYHDMGLIGGVLQPMQVARPSYLMAPATFLSSPIRWLKAISRYRATISGAPNFAYDLCVNRTTPAQREGLDLTNWRVAFNGAEPVRGETLERFAETFAEFGFRASASYPCYGLAESTLIVTGGVHNHPPITLTVSRSALEQHRVEIISSDDSNDSDARVLVGCGGALIDQRVLIVDSETLKPCPPGWTGEIWVASRSVAQGYWNRPDESARTFRGFTKDGDGPYLRTGDLGFLHEGELFIAGRAKDLIILRGRNLYPQDIEQTVENCHVALRPGCGAAVAVDGVDGERLVIIHELERTGRSLPTDEIVDTICRAVAEAHEVQVDAVVLLRPGSVPKTSSGKIQRHACKNGFIADELDAIGKWERPVEATADAPSFVQNSAASADDIQEWLIEQIARKLRIDPEKLDPREPLARYGLDSLSAVQTAGELESWLGRPVSPVLIYDHPTIESLACYLARDVETVQSSNVAQTESRNPSSDIAVIGIGCRFPGANGPMAFWNLLRDGVDAISEVPADRWDVDDYFDPDINKPGTMNTRWGGFLKEVDRFDRGFFGISPREAERMDPQQRLLLETAWEALEDAGQNVDRLAGRPVGVFVGISANDYGRMQGDSASLDAYVGTGNALSIAANRLSYAFDFRGPSMAIDTACSSSLVAIHLAAQSLKRGETELAIAGGVNLILSPELTVNFTRAGMMAPDGRCKAFDAAANGYVRGEGCGVVVLKPLAQAQADGDPINAVIRGSAVNQDGRSNGLTAPNRPAQEAVLRAAYQDAGIQPADIDAIEAHGTGTSLGDPIEALALGSVLAEGRPNDRPALLGSVKSNIGHLESAAGVAGFIKMALALKNGELPPTLHFREANPHIPFAQLPLRVATDRQPWPNRQRSIRAGVSSFGFGGTNAHVVLEQFVHHAVEQQSTSPLESGHAQIVPLSARSAEALNDVARDWIDRFADRDVRIDHIAFTAANRRTHHDHRLAVVAHSSKELCENLQAWIDGNARTGTSEGRRSPSRKPRVAWLFAGQGSQWIGMGRQLFVGQPVFREAIERCDAIFRTWADWSIVDELNQQDDPALIDATDRVQPLVFALQVGLAELWKSWGMEPAAVIGHSLGEVAAAHVIGALSLDDAARIVFHRARLQHRLSGQGKMAAVGLSVADSHAAINGFQHQVSIAAINGPRSTVWSGDPSSLRAALEPLAQRDVFHRELRGQIAFHSPQMEPLRREFQDSVGEVMPRQSKIPYYSTVTGSELDASKLDCEYWARNLREPVLFAAAADAVIAAGFEMFLEISPHPVLVEPLNQCLRQRQIPGIVLSSMRRDTDQQTTLLSALGMMYARGASPNWQQIQPSRQVASLPSYPWQRDRCWWEAPKQGANGYHRNGYSKSELNGQSRDASPEDRWLIRPSWSAIEFKSASTRLSGTWIVFADDQFIAAQLRRQLEANGAKQVVVVASGENYAAINEDCYCVNPSEPEQMKRLVREAIVSPADLTGVIHASATSTATCDVASAEVIATAQERGAISTLHLVQALIANGATPRVWIVTRGAQAVDDTDAPNVAQAPIWGMGRVLAHEHPELAISLVDFDPTPTSNDVAQLIALISQDSEETEFAIRDERALVARLTSAPEIGRAHEPRIRAEGTYLITGGLGGLGLQVARWMVGRGARSLVLTGRRGATTESERVLSELRAIGANIVIARADVADYQQLAAVVADIDHNHPTLRGVIHAAGVLDDGIALQQNRHRVWNVLAPKLLGGWHLHALTAGRKLDFFALFSSAASLFGSPGQSNYSAANAALDGLASFRRARNLPAVSINWGPWAGAGMASRDSNADRLAQMGMGLIDANRGLDLFGRLLASPYAQVGVVPADWTVYRRRLGGQLPLILSNLVGPEESPVEQPTQRVPSALNRNALNDVPPDDWQSIIEGQLREQSAHVLRLAAHSLDVEQPLSNLGVDSLMAIELKNRIEADLGVTVPMVKFLEGPSVRDLSQYLADQLIALHHARTAGAAPTSASSGIGSPADEIGLQSAGQLLANIDALSDAQVDALLAELTAAEKGDG